MTPERRERQRAASRRYFATAKGREARARGQRKHGARQTREHRQRLRQIVAQIKDQPCKDCGGRFPAVCMDFDHRPGEVKLFAVSALNRSLDAILAEIAKCDVVCANCHRIRTHDRGDHMGDGNG